MKRFTFLALFLPLISFAQQKTTPGFTIKGAIKGLSENSVVTLTDLNNSSDTVARTLVKKGVFTLVGKIDEPNIYQLNFHEVQKKSILFIGNENISISGEIDKVQNFQVTGSTVHKDFSDFQNSFTPLVSRLSELNKKIASNSNIQRTDSVMVAYEANLKQIQKTIDDFVANKKGSPVAPFVVLVTSEMEQMPEVIENRFNRLDENQKQGFYGKILSEQIADSKVGAVGTEAISFIQNDTTGKPVSLKSFRGKYVLVDFWASWCGPCRMENPNLVEAFNKFKSKNFTVLGVSLDRDKASWIQAIQDDQLTWTHVSDLKYWNNEVAKTYRIQSIPQNILIGPDGKIVGKNLRGSNLHAKLCELLGCDN